jgi:hypothetical protein
MMPDSIRAAEMNYDKVHSEYLRQELVHLRDQFLEVGDMGVAVILSHMVAWMAVAIETMELK